MAVDYNSKFSYNFVFRWSKLSRFIIIHFKKRIHTFGKCHCLNNLKQHTLTSLLETLFKTMRLMQKTDLSFFLQRWCLFSFKFPCFREFDRWILLPNLITLKGFLAESSYSIKIKCNSCLFSQ